MRLRLVDFYKFITQLIFVFCLLFTSCEKGGSDSFSQDSHSEFLAINIDRLNSSASMIPFIDVFKQSGGSNLDPWSPSVPVDSSGYPLEVTSTTVSTSMLTIANGHYPVGTYTLVFTGDGSVSIGGDSAGSFNQPGGTGTYHFIVQQPTSTGIRLAITRSSISNHVRDIHVILPGHEADYTSRTFNPAFIEKLQGFSAIRFMRWSRTNDSLLSNWSQRTTPSHATQARNYGPAYEYSIQLCNEVQASLWLNIPHLATDDFVLQLAQLVKNQLNSNLNVYVEYSNELWNIGSFSQGTYSQDMGLSLGLNSDRVKAGRYYVAKRSAEIFNIFTSVFSDNPSRVIKILPTQSGSVAVSNDILLAFRQTQMNGTSINPWGIEASSLAGAPYFGSHLGEDLITEGVLSSITIPEIMDRIRTTYLPQSIQRMNIDRNVINAYNQLYQTNLQMMAYEGGQSVVADANNLGNVDLIQKLLEVNRSSEMYDIYQTYFSNWLTYGGQTFAHFNLCQTPTPGGAFGALEYIDQPIDAAPKYQSLFDIIHFP